MKISQKKALKKAVTFADIAVGQVFYLAGTEDDDGSVDNGNLYMKIASGTGRAFKFAAVILESGETDETVVDEDSVVVVKAHLTVEV